MTHPDPETPADDGTGTADEGSALEEFLANQLLDEDEPDEPWWEYVDAWARSHIINATQVLGLNTGAYLAWYETNQEEMMNFLNDKYASKAHDLGPGTMEMLGTMGLWWIRGNRPELGDDLMADTAKKPRGGTGRRTEAQIRAQFDIDEMARSITDLWRGYLLEEPEDARGIARGYIDQVVKNPDQKLDFKSYVVRQIEGTSKYNNFTRQKPETLGYEDFITPYIQQAMQVLGGGEEGQLQEIVGAGAGLNASPSAFASRLAKTNEVTGSSPFMQNVEARLSRLRGVFKDG